MNTKMNDLIQAGAIASMGANAWAVYCCLVHVVEKERRIPGVAYYANLTGLSFLEVSKALNVLSGLGLIPKVEEPQDGRIWS